MKILAASQIRQVDQQTIQMEPISPIELMERAAEVCFQWILKNMPAQKEFHVFCGPGNNGGDGMAIARKLGKKSYKVFVYLLTSPDQFSKDTATNYHRLIDAKTCTLTLLEEHQDFPEINANCLIIDAIFGTGLSRPLKGWAEKTVLCLNQKNVPIISIDLPSGLYADNKMHANDIVVHAKYTLTFQFPKLSFMFGENEKFIGSWECLNINLHQESIEAQETNYNYLLQDDIFNRFLTRKKFDHKGKFGHALLLAGSYGRIGAAVLASKACLRSGVGLLTVQIPSCGYEILQTAIPEAMVITDNCHECLSNLSVNEYPKTIGIGPGLGSDIRTVKMLHQILQNIKTPLVLDADALNILSQYPEWMSLVPKGSILTPHPKEFDRLTAVHDNSWDRHLDQISLSRQYGIIVVLKGAHTSITDPNGNCWFNSTGNPGMATAGSGDVLTGIILSLLAQGYSSFDAALVGVFLHGRSGDIARLEWGENALIASDLIFNLGKAFQSINNKIY